MGRARIVSNRGGGLYTATPLYDFTALDQELAKLQQAEADYAGLLVQAVNTLALLEKDEAIARSTMNAIIDQWKAGLIAKGNEVPPALIPPTPNDPLTGLPWIDPDRAQEQPLLDRINSERTAASKSPVARNSDLDAAALSHLRSQAGTGQQGHFGAYQSKPIDRAAAQGYLSDIALELLNYGKTSPDGAVDEWMKDDELVDELLDAGVEDAGIAYLYAANHPATHLWCAVLAKPYSGPTITWAPFPDPAKEAANDSVTTLEKIELPRSVTDEPAKLNKAVAAFAVAASKRIAADREITRLMAERIARLQRIADLTALKATLDAIEIDVWACYATDALSVGDTVYTAEVPGHLALSPAVSRSSVIYEGTVSETSVSYAERAWNITQRQPEGRLRPAESISPELVFANAAIEPGHERWKPTWRYGIITAKTGNSCSLTLNACLARPASTKEFVTNPMNINPPEPNLVNVPIDYPPCYGEPFSVGDEVLVRFVGYAWTGAQVVGFRRAPKPCSIKKISWGQIA